MTVESAIVTVTAAQFPAPVPEAPAAPDGAPTSPAAAEVEDAS